MATPTHQLTLVADERHYDLVVPVGTRVTDVLSVLGISSSAVPELGRDGSAGTSTGPQDRLGDDLPAGSVLTVVRTTTHRLHRDVVSLDRSSSAPGARSRRARLGRRRPAQSRREPDGGAGPRRRLHAPARRARPRRHGEPRRPRGPPPGPRPHVGRGRGTRRAPDLVVPALVRRAGPAVRRGGRARPPRRHLRGRPPGCSRSATARWVAAAALLGGAVVVTLAVPRDRAGAPALRLAGGARARGRGRAHRPARRRRRSASRCTACSPAPSPSSCWPSGPPTARRPTAPSGPRPPAWAASARCSRPASSSAGPPSRRAALVLGLAPVLVRALPSASLAVDPTQLVDVDRLSTTVWAVRERHAGRRRRVTARRRARARRAGPRRRLGRHRLPRPGRVARAGGSSPWHRRSPTSRPGPAGCCPRSPPSPWATRPAASVTGSPGSRCSPARQRSPSRAGYAVLAEHPSWVPGVVGVAVAVAAGAVVGAVALTRAATTRPASPGWPTASRRWRSCSCCRSASSRPVASRRCAASPRAEPAQRVTPRPAASRPRRPRTRSPRPRS